MALLRSAAELHRDAEIDESRPRSSSASRRSGSRADAAHGAERAPIEARGARTALDLRPLHRPIRGDLQVDHHGAGPTAGPLRRSARSTASIRVTRSESQSRTPGPVCSRATAGRRAPGSGRERRLRQSGHATAWGTAAPTARDRGSTLRAGAGRLASPALGRAHDTRIAFRPAGPAAASMMSSLPTSPPV